MAGFLSLPSKELAQERRRNCNPFLIAASGFITGLIYPIFAFRHRNKNILISWLSIAAVIVLCREFEYLKDPVFLTSFWENPVVGSIDWSINFIIYSKYGAACAHFVSIFFITWIDKNYAQEDLLRPLLNEEDAFPLKVRKTKSILKNIFDIDNEKVNDIYDLAKGDEGELPLIEDLNYALRVNDLEPVQFCKKDGLKIIPGKLRANLEKKPDNKKKGSSKKTKATANKESSSFSESFKTIITYGGGGLIGVFVIRAAKEILSN